MNSLYKIAAILVLLWLAAWGITHVIGMGKPTPEKLAAYLKEHPIENLPEKQREQVLLQTAKMLNRFDFEQRQQLRRSEELRGFLVALNEQERLQFYELTLPAGFQQMMQALNNMTKTERGRIVQRALRDLDEQESPFRENSEELSANDPRVKRIIEEGFTAFYRDASAETKLDFAPVLERMQAVTQNLR